jgi:hypothetical protein
MYAVISQKVLGKGMAALRGPRGLRRDWKCCDFELDGVCMMYSGERNNSAGHSIYAFLCR